MWKLTFQGYMLREFKTQEGTSNCRSSRSSCGSSSGSDSSSNNNNTVNYIVPMQKGMWGDFYCMVCSWYFLRILQYKLDIVISFYQSLSSV